MRPVETGELQLGDIWSGRGAQDELEVTAWTEDQTIMGVRHKKYRLVQGVQFHPESIITESGKTIVKNFVDSLDSDE